MQVNVLSRASDISYAQSFCTMADAHAHVQAKLDEHPLFERISDKELEADPAADLLTSATEEGQKVARNLGEVNLIIHRFLISS